MANSTFAKYVLDIPNKAGWDLLVATGWRPTTHDYERFFSFPAEGTISPSQRKILSLACKELEQSIAVLEDKIQRQNVHSKKADTEERRQAALLAMKDDRERRKERFHRS